MKQDSRLLVGTVVRAEPYGIQGTIVKVAYCEYTDRVWYFVDNGDMIQEFEDFDLEVV